ncbi:Na/Pi cotransporter family protein [Enhygromyxa salina]|uniref:Na+/Pi-cotransporter n=1 Tax=Enhygromyxa salina TaxID=215803 RepID=A0A2S9XTF2_9BACT|nr:Na/Pi cotransporter family protein [Enhygromyxa salina]PRP96001.1 Na+/Pi-cotransporter [Enhygromyxa salina]
MISTKARKRALGFVLALLLVGVYALVSWIEAEQPDAAADVRIPMGAKPRIIDVQPSSAPPGGTVVVHFVSEIESREEVLAIVDGVKVPPLDVRGDEVVFQVPDVAHGTADLRISLNGRKSPPRPLPIEAPNYLKSIRNVVGGLALVLLGLLTLSRAFRHRAGATLRRRVGGLTRSMRSSMTFGVAIGGVTQTSTLAAALALPSAERRLLSFSSAVTLVLAAHVGAVMIGSVLPLAASREAPLVIAVGVILRLTATDQRARSTAKIVTGVGLLLFGAHMLRSGFAPLAEQPSVLLDLRHLDVSSLTGLVLAATFGAFAAFVTQGPGVVFVLVLSVTQATSFLSVDQALAILVGTSVASALSTTLVSWPLGLTSRRIALAHGILALASVLVMWLMLPWLPELVATLLRSDPEEIDRGKKLLHPNVGLHLAVGFIVMQCVATLAVFPIVGRLSKLLRPAYSRSPTRELGPSLQPISVVLLEQKRALEQMKVVLEGEPDAPAVLERHLERARELADAHLAQASAGSTDTDTLVSILSVEQSLEQVRYTVERAARRGVRLEGEGGRFIHELHALLLAGLDDAVTLVGGGSGPEIDDLRAREIQINATEAALREFLRAQIEAGDVTDSTNLLRLAELANGYETVGNQLYRLGLGLVPEDF